MRVAPRRNACGLCDSAAPNDVMTAQSAIIVGANGAIGAALASHYAGTGYGPVHCLTRAEPFHCDLARTDMIGPAIAAIGALDSVERVIIASGILHDGTMGPEKSMRALDGQWLMRQFQVNCIGPAIFLSQLLPQLNRRRPLRVGVLSARVGSISDNRLGGWYGYRASKAALNQMVRSFAIEWRRTHPLAAIVALHPGTVASRLSAPFTAQRNPSDLAKASDSAASLAMVLDNVGPNDSGRIFDYAGREILP